MLGLTIPTKARSVQPSASVRIVLSNDDGLVKSPVVHHAGDILEGKVEIVAPDISACVLEVCFEGWKYIIPEQEPLLISKGITRTWLGWPSSPEAGDEFLNGEHKVSYVYCRLDLNSQYSSFSENHRNSGSILMTFRNRMANTITPHLFASLSHTT